MLLLTLHPIDLPPYIETFIGDYGFQYLNSLFEFMDFTLQRLKFGPLLTAEALLPLPQPHKLQYKPTGYRDNRDK